MYRAKDTETIERSQHLPNPVGVCEQGVLRMVSLIDRLDDGLSAVYTFFDPDQPCTAYGVYNVLWQVDLARRLQLSYLYLGYWIAESPKMAYKTRYRPLERLDDGRWRAFEP